MEPMIKPVVARVDFIREMYHSGFPRELSEAKEVTIHGTGGGANAAAIMRWMKDLAQPWESDRWKRGVALYHFLIDRTGDVYQFIDLDRWVYHSSSGIHDKTTIGIELMNPVANNMGAYTVQQYEALNELIGNIIRPLCPIERISSHQYNYRNYSGGDKSCPGPHFNWDKVNFQGISILKAVA